MEEWLSTGAAAAMLGTSTTTVRAMASRGALRYQTEPRAHRTRWRISSASVAEWLATNERIDQRRRSSRTAATQSGDAAQANSRVLLLEEELRRARATQADLVDNVAALKAVALALRARNDAVTAAEAHQARAARLLLDAATEQANAADALRRALVAQDDAIGQLVVPGPPQ